MELYVTFLSGCIMLAVSMKEEAGHAFSRYKNTHCCVTKIDKRKGVCPAQLAAEASCIFSTNYTLCCSERKGGAAGRRSMLLYTHTKTVSTGQCYYSCESVNCQRRH